MKKILTLLITLMLLTTACSKDENTSFEKYLEEGKIAIANEEYDKALNFFTLAKEEDSNNEELNSLYNQTNNLIEAIKSKENKQYTISIQLCETIESINSETNVIKDAAKKLKEECTNLMNEDKTSENNTTKEEDPSKQDNTPTQTEQASTKQYYLDLLSSIQAEVSELENDENYTGTTAGMNSLASLSYEKWDGALNKIYDELKNQLSSNEMETLKTKQKNWLKYRDEQAENNASEWEGGSFAPVEYGLTLANLTKERCYELVNQYMN